VAATVHDGSLYADKLQQAFADNFKKLGGTITAQEAVAPTDTDMKPMLTRVAATKPDFFYLPIFIAAGGRSPNRLKKSQVLRTSNWRARTASSRPTFSKRPATRRSLQLVQPRLLRLSAGYADFLKKHEAKYGEKTLAPFHAHAYDAANIIFASIEKVAVRMRTARCTSGARPCATP